MTADASIMTAGQIAASVPRALPQPGETALQLARKAMEQTGQWHPLQTMGRHFPIGCVALEITQRCNLDCSLCYLSDHSEAVKDMPLAEVFRRIDQIRAHYGPRTDVQITGGDPTLRKREELVAIVAQVAAAGMRPALFTNGIKATPELLAELCAAGLVDVAFHVDMTQQRRGYGSEAELNAVRMEYIQRCRGLPLSVLFNATVFDGNRHEIAGFAAFFVCNAHAVRLASFQLQADAGRGAAGGSQSPITIDTVAASVSAGAGMPISFDTPVAGHASCNRYAMTLVANGRAHDLLDDKAVLAAVLDATAGVEFDRKRPARAVLALAGALARRPRTAARIAPFMARKAWAMRRDLIAGGLKAHKLSFFIHDFMDSSCLDCDRVAACAFMVATADGPISMCLHNAKRDQFILQPIWTGDGTGWWDPLTGRIAGQRQPGTVAHTRKTLKGRLKEAAMRVSAAPADG